MTLQVSAYGHQVYDNYHLFQICHPNYASTPQLDQDVYVIARTSLPTPTTYIWGCQIHAVGTFRVRVTSLASDPLFVYAPNGKNILTIYSGNAETETQSFTITKNNVGKKLNNLITFQYTPNATRNAGTKISAYSIWQVPQLDDYKGTQTFQPGTNESFTYTTTGWTAVISRPLTIGQVIPLFNYTSANAPYSYTLTSSNATFSGSSASSATAVVEPPGVISVTSTVASTTPITPVTITFSFASLNTSVPINPAVFRDCSIFWVPPSLSTTAEEDENQQDKSNNNTTIIEQQTQKRSFEETSLNNNNNTDEEEPPSKKQDQKGSYGGIFQIVPQVLN